MSAKRGREKSDRSVGALIVKGNSFEERERIIRELLKTAIEVEGDAAVPTLTDLFEALNDYACLWLDEKRKFPLRPEASALFSAISAVISRELNTSKDPSLILSRLVEVLEQSQAKRNNYHVQGLDRLPTPRLHITATGGERGTRTLYVTIAAGLICSYYVPTVVQGNYSVTGCECGNFAESDIMTFWEYPVGSSEYDFRSLQERRFAYLHVQRYQPISKVFCAERASVGFRDMMKLTTALADPYHCDRQFIGVWDRRFMEPMARVLRSRNGIKAGAIVASTTHDEFTNETYTFGPRKMRPIKLIAPGKTPNDDESVQSEDELEPEVTWLKQLLTSSTILKSPRQHLILHNAAFALAVAHTKASAPTATDISNWTNCIKREWRKIAHHNDETMTGWKRLVNRES